MKTNQGAVAVILGQEGNQGAVDQEANHHRSGTAAATNHRFCGISTYRLTTTHTTTIFGPFSGTTRVRQCQKRTSGLYGARED